MVLQKIANLPWFKKPRAGSNPVSSAFTNQMSFRAFWFVIIVGKTGLEPFLPRVGK